MHKKDKSNSGKVTPYDVTEFDGTKVVPVNMSGKTLAQINHYCNELKMNRSHFIRDLFFMIHRGDFKALENFFEGIEYAKKELANLGGRSEGNRPSQANA